MSSEQVVRWGWNTQGWASPWSSERDDLLYGCGAIDFAGSGMVSAALAAGGVGFGVKEGNKGRKEGRKDDGCSHLACTP